MSIYHLLNPIPDPLSVLPFPSPQLTPLVQSESVPQMLSLLALPLLSLLVLQMLSLWTLLLSLSTLQMLSLSVPQRELLMIPRCHLTHFPLQFPLYPPPLMEQILPLPHLSVIPFQQLPQSQFPPPLPVLLTAVMSLS